MASPNREGNGKSASLRARTLANAIWWSRKLPVVGQMAADALLDDKSRPDQPHWQTSLEMEKAGHEEFFAFFEVDESILRDRDVLDIGCGYGGNLLRWARSHPSSLFVGIEPFPKVVTIAAGARRAYAIGNASFLAAAGERLPFDDDSFDLIMTYDVIEHVSDPSLVLLEIARCLRPGGTYLGVFPPYFNPLSHHLTYVTRLPWLHHMFSPQLLVDAVNHLIDDDRLKLHRQPTPQRGPWGRTTLPTLNGTTIKDWLQLCENVKKAYPVEIQNILPPFAQRLPWMISAPIRLLQRVFPEADMFCGHVVTRMRKA